MSKLNLLSVGDKVKLNIEAFKEGKWLDVSSHDEENILKSIDKEFLVYYIDGDGDDEYPVWLDGVFYENMCFKHSELTLVERKNT